METLNNESYMYPIAIHKLSSEEKDIIKRLKKTGINCKNVLDIITIDDDQINTYCSQFANDINFKNALNKLKNKITTSPEYIRKYMAPISFSSIQRELMECLDYIKAFPDDRQNFFKASIVPNSDIQSLSTQFNMTLRMAKKEFKNLYEELQSVLCYKSEKYKNYFMSVDTNDIRLEMPELWSKFSNDSFYIFIKNMFELDEDFSTSNQIDNIDIDECFDNIFSEVVMPCSIETFRNSFYEYEGLNYTQINSLVPQIEKRGLVTIENKKVVSAKLTFKTSVIQILLQSQKDLTWDDILQKINYQKLFTSSIPSKEEFIDSLGLYDSVIQVSEDNFIHADKSNVTMDLIDRCVDKIQKIKNTSSQISLEELQKKLNEKISIFELKHIMQKAF